MRLHIRRILLGFSYTAFVIIAPLIILYAIGYRPQISSPIPRAVGVVLADATPGRATVSVNGTAYGTLPRAVPNIDPGLTLVEIAKEGYSTWKKSLEVKSTQATDVRSVRLLPSSFESEVVANNARMFAASPTNLLIAITDKDNVLSVRDTDGTIVPPTHPLLRQPTKISWSPDGTYILVSFPKNSYELFHINRAQLEKVPSKLLNNSTNIIWSPIAPNTLYGLTTTGDIISHDISKGANETIAQNVTTYEISNRTIYYQTFENELISQSLRSQDPRTIIQDTGKSIKKISAGNNNTLALLFIDGELTLYTGEGYGTTISPSVLHMSWSPDGQLLLLQTAPTELHVYNVGNERLFAIPQGELRLITRLSQPITFPEWFSDSQHIIFQANDTIVFSEIDTRDHAIATPIDTTSTRLPIAIGEGSKSILYIKENGSASRLVQTWLLTPADR